jgi:serine/threonine-protein kinase
MPVAQQNPDNAAPRKLGRYHVLDEIGRDRIFIVHLARLEGPSGFQRWAVVRRVRPELRRIPGFDAAFYDAVRASGRIDHPNVVATHDVGEDEGQLWVAIEYAQGEMVEDMLDRMREARTTVPWDVACKVINDASLGVDGIHSSRDPAGKRLGLLHGHLAPRSLVVTYAGKTKVLDPCMPVIPTDVEASITVSDDMSAVLPYLAPEQVWGDAVDARSDVFSLGVILWEMCAGRRLFMGRNEDETRALLEAGTVPELRATVRGFPGSIDAIVHRATQRDRSLRFATASDLARSLHEATVARGVVVSDEDVGRFMMGLFADRFEEREALLKQAVEVTEIFRRSSLDPSALAPRPPGAVARARPAAGAPPPLLAPPVPSRRPPQAAHASHDFEPAVSDASDEGPTVVFGSEEMAAVRGGGGDGDGDETVVRRPESERDPSRPGSDPPRVQIAPHVLGPEFPEVPTTVALPTQPMPGRPLPQHPPATQRMHPGGGLPQASFVPPLGPQALPPGMAGMVGMPRMPQGMGGMPGNYPVHMAVPSVAPVKRGPTLIPTTGRPHKGNMVRAVEYVAIGAMISAAAMVGWRWCSGSGNDDLVSPDPRAMPSVPTTTAPSVPKIAPTMPPLLPMTTSVATPPTGIASALPKPPLPPTFVGPAATTATTPKTAAPPPVQTHRTPPPPPPVVEKKPPPDPVAPPIIPTGGGTGLLTVICSPACDQVIDGANVLGSSPVYKVQVKAGTHHLRLRTSDPPVEKTYDVTVKADDITVAKIPMTP